MEAEVWPSTGWSRVQGIAGWRAGKIMTGRRVALVLDQGRQVIIYRRACPTNVCLRELVMSIGLTVQSAFTPTSAGTPAGDRRFRGRGKQLRWQRPEQVSVIVLPLVVDGDRERRRLEKLFAAMHSIKRALQRDVRKRLGAYGASPGRLQQDAAEWREQLGLTREGLERRAYRHLERSGWLLDHVSKALAMHQAGEVWAGVERHLFGDGEGRRSEMPRVGSYWDFLRIAGRARSHTTEHKWETFRLFGTLAGHLAAYRHPQLPKEITSPAQSASLAPGAHVLAQPRHPRPPDRVGSWWDHTGPLVLVFSGGPTSKAGELVLPVRLPQGAGRWPYLLHYLDRPEQWHKVDLVRRRDASAPGGWAYEAHLMILGDGYCSPATRARRQGAADLQRVGGVDGNMSNLAVVSFPGSYSPADPGVPAKSRWWGADFVGWDGDVASTWVRLSEEEKARLAQKHRKDRARQRALHRSRRASNPQQYHLSRRQRKRGATGGCRASGAPAHRAERRTYGRFQGQAGAALPQRCPEQGLPAPTRKARRSGGQLPGSAHPSGATHGCSDRGRPRSSSQHRRRQRKRLVPALGQVMPGLHPRPADQSTR